MWAPDESRPRRASFSCSRPKIYHHHKSSSSMSYSSAPNLRRLNASALLGERAMAMEGHEPPLSKIPRPFVPKMKAKFPFILSPSPKLEFDRHNPHIPSLPPENKPCTPKSPGSESRSREQALADELHSHRYMITSQWRWLYENRVLPTETVETFLKPFHMDKRDRDRHISHIPVPSRPLKSSRSLGLIENDRNHKHQPKMPPRSSSLAARRGRRQMPDLEKTPTPTGFQFPRTFIVARDNECNMKNGNLSPVHYGNEDISVLSPAVSSHTFSKTINDDEEISSDDGNSDCGESSKSNGCRQSIDTTATSILSSQTSRVRRGRNHQFARTEDKSNFHLSNDEAKVQLEQELGSRFDVDSDSGGDDDDDDDDDDDGDDGEKDEDFVSRSTVSSRNSIASVDEGFVPTPLTAIPARAYSNAQKIQIWTNSSQSIEGEIRRSLVPKALRIRDTGRGKRWGRMCGEDEGRFPPSHSPPPPLPVMGERWQKDLRTGREEVPTSQPPLSNFSRNQQRVLPWASTLNTPPMSPQQHSHILEYNQNLVTSNPPRTSSLAHASGPPPPYTPKMRYSPYPDDSGMTPGSPPLTSIDFAQGIEEEEDFATPTQESVLRPSHRALPKVRLDFPLQTPSASYPRSTVESSADLYPVLPSQIDSFSTDDESILQNLEKAVCSVHPSLCLSTPCISKIRIISHSDIESSNPSATKTPLLSSSRPSFYKQPLKSHPTKLTTKPPSIMKKRPITRRFGTNSHYSQHPRQHQQHRNLQDVSPNCPQENIRTTPSDLSSFRMIFPATTDKKRDELYAYLLAYNYLTDLPKPLSSNRRQSNEGKSGCLQSPFSSRSNLPDMNIFPELPTPETVVTEKAAATLGIMSSEECLRTVRLEDLSKELVDRVKEGISRLVSEMDVGGLNRSGVIGERGRGEGYVIERTLLRTLAEHVGVCEENGWLSEENGGLWKRIFVKVREGMGIGAG